jgi:hypothetical protein
MRLNIEHNALKEEVTQSVAFFFWFRGRLNLSSQAGARPLESTHRSAPPHLVKLAIVKVFPMKVLL